MVKIRCFIGLLVVVLVGCGEVETANNSTGSEVVEEANYTSDDVLQGYYDDKVDAKQVLIKAEVVRILSDDVKGDKHQRFIVELKSGQTLLIAHNIDIAPRVKGIREKDEVIVYGQYEWSDKGGVIHWTHHDPAGLHEDGWVKHNAIVYN